MEHATPDGRPSQFESWAEAALSNVVSPPPPANAPLRKSMTKGQLENTIGKPGEITLTITRLASVSANDWARKPAIVAGAVAPAWAAVMHDIGMLCLMHS